MALNCNHFSVYVAFNFAVATLLCFTFPASGGGASNTLSLLQPYDFLYYSGVRSYFGEEWVKAAELLEKAIVTKEALLRVRRQCHEDCVSAGKDSFSKLGKL